MKIVNRKEGEQWLQNHNLPIEGRELRKFFKNSSEFIMRSASSSQIKLAEFLVGYIDDCEEEAALWIKDWAIGDEKMNLLMGIEKV